MDVEPRTARHLMVYEGETFFFCAPGCKKAFEANPQKYVDPEHQASMPGL